LGLIRILPDQVANKIAAGEVVERPASVVKELLENSLDAGATQVRIDVDSGGKRLIRIADNGLGMMRDDALLAFERHATSKLRDVGDLLSIATLGFRGEALPSIASVARVELETRIAQETTGTRLEIAGGKLLNVSEIAREPGATITVRDLFFNMPARRKFLRSEQTELAHIAQLATHYALAHPDKAFRLAAPTGELLQVTPVETLRERVFQVFGNEILEDLVSLGACEKRLVLPPEPPDPPEEKLFRLTGFVSRPQVQKLNRNSIYIFVNRRLIRDRLLLHALSAAYYNLMPAGCYPFALLFLEAPFDEVDVNVHPSKTEVRFRHQNFVHDLVRDAVRDRLVDSKPVSSFPVPAQPPQAAATVPFSDASLLLQESDFTLRASPAPAPRLDFSTAPPIEVTAAAPAPPLAPTPDTHPLESLASIGELRPLGQVRDSFIVAAGPDGLWIIDQHVAHERVLFEKVLRDRSRGGVERQQLLVPMVIRLSPDQQIRFARLAEELALAGFEIEPFGRGTVAVKTAPAGVSASEIEKLLQEVLDLPESELRSLTPDDLRRKVAASIACHAAIKINTPLDVRKMQWLLEELAKTDCPMSCPHGRPIVLRYSMRDILKAFHRA
jgi:DNA mismatch repair protein MutL